MYTKGRRAPPASVVARSQTGLPQFVGRSGCDR